MLRGFLGKKIGMSQVFTEEGLVMPVTMIQAGPCSVTQIKTNANDGYEAVQVDGSYHDVDSSEMAFRSAGNLAIREGVRKGRPVLLEPMFELEVVTPGEYLSEVIGDLGQRRAQIRNIEGEDDIQVVRAMIPLGETFSYTTAVRSITKGRATYSMEFKYYEPVPESILKTLANVG